MKKIKLGISTCLLGELVRYDGQHKLDSYLRDTLGEYMEYVSVCPEVEMGLSIPREALHLFGDPENPRLVTVKTNVDHTEGMSTWAQKRLRELEAENLCGYILKKKSPSCGMERVKVYNKKGVPGHDGVGLYAAALKARFPLLPVEEEGRLHDPELRINFIERIFTFQRWRELLAEGHKLGNLVMFHAQHKYLLHSHSETHARQMGKIVAGDTDLTLTERFEQYETLLLKAMSLKATRSKHVNVLQHMLGYFKKDLSADEKQEVLEILDQYAAGTLPLIVPVTLINHFVRKYKKDYLADQFYLHPHPIELQLRNHG